MTNTQKLAMFAAQNAASGVGQLLERERTDSRAWYDCDGVPELAESLRAAILIAAERTPGLPADDKGPSQTEADLRTGLLDALNHYLEDEA